MFAWTAGFLPPSSMAASSFAPRGLSPPGFAPLAVVPAPVCVRDAGRMRASVVVMTGGRVDKDRRAANAPGPFFVDESCIDCDTCRWMVPGTFGRAGTKSFVHTQPESDAARAEAAEAAVACPTGSIRTERAMPEAAAARDAFPKPVDAQALPNVYHLGWHSAASFGATPYLLSFHAPTAGTIGGTGPPAEKTNVMIDCPRYNSRLAKALEARGGVHLLLLTHKDDVSDHNKWKARFPSLRRVMHAADVRGTDRWPYIDMSQVEHQLHGPGPWDLSSLPGLESINLPPHLLIAIHTPGHSAGSLSFLARQPLVNPDTAGGGSAARHGHTAGDTGEAAAVEDAGDGGVLFSGDHFAYSARLGRLDGMGRYGDDLQLQARSIAKLADEPFLSLLPGHARRYAFASAADRRRAIAEAAREFADDPLGSKAKGGAAQRG